MIRILFFLSLAIFSQINASESKLPQCFEWDADPKHFAGEKVAVRGFVLASWIDSCRKEEAGTMVVIRQTHPALSKSSKYLVLKLPFQLVPNSTDLVEFLIVGRMTLNDSAVLVENNLGTIDNVSLFEFRVLTDDMKQRVIEELSASKRVPEGQGMTPKE
jgi:hypothetical protein